MAQFSVGVNIAGYDIGDLSFQDTIEIESADGKVFSDGGDSGAMIIDPNMCAVGLLFGGSDVGGSNGLGLGYANVMSNVMSALNVTLMN